MLTQKEKNKVRTEEIFRQEVRISLDKNSSNNKIITFLNTNLGLFLLSTVLIGLISFLYTNWETKKSFQQINFEKIDNITDEVTFRAKQVDKAFSNVNISYKALGNKNSTLGQNIENYLETTRILSVTCKLSGITNFPPSLNQPAYIYLYHSNYSQADLPFKRGFKNQDYQFLSLYNLLKKLNSLNSNVVNTEVINEFLKLLNDFDQLSDYDDSISEDWLIKKNYTSNSPKLKNIITDFGDKISKINIWTQELSNCWNRIKQNDLLKKNIADF